jgi:hypothetical protein
MVGITAVALWPDGHLGIVARTAIRCGSIANMAACGELLRNFSADGAALWFCSRFGAGGRRATAESELELTLGHRPIVPA